MKAAFYGRVSTEEQAEKGNIESQVDFAKRYFDLHGSVIDIDSYETYLDEGISGTLPLQARPASAQMMADARAGKFQAVYVYRLDRLARSTLHVLSAFEFFDSLGIALKSMTEAFDTGTSSGKFFMTMLASIAALERDTILERTQLGKERAIKDNRWTSGLPPFGYRVGEDKKLVIEETEAEIVKLIFKLYLEGMTIIPIAEYLNARDIPTPTRMRGIKNITSGKWNISHISLILRNAAYIGEYQTMRRSKNNKKQKDGKIMQIPSLIDKDSFQRADKMLLGNLDTARGSRGRDYILRGLVFCGNCGRAFVGSSGNSKQNRVYYRCTGAINKGSGKLCDAKIIRAKDIEDAVWSDIQSFLAEPETIANAIEKALSKGKTELEPVEGELDEIEKSLLEKQAARQKILSFISKNLISDKEAENQLLALAGEINILSSRKEKLLNRVYKRQELSNQAINASRIIDIFKESVQNPTEEDKKQLIRGFVHKVTVYTDIVDNEKQSRILIDYYFPLYEFEHFRRC